MQGLRKFTIAAGVVLASTVPASAITLQQYLINIGFLAPGEAPSSFTCTGASTGTASVVSGGMTFTTNFDASPDTIDECVGAGGGNNANAGNNLANAADGFVQQANQVGGINRLFDRFNARKPACQAPRARIQKVVDALLKINVELILNFQERRDIEDRLDRGGDAFDQKVSQFLSEQGSLDAIKREVRKAEREVISRNVLLTDLKQQLGDATGADADRLQQQIDQVTTERNSADKDLDAVRDAAQRTREKIENTPQNIREAGASTRARRDRLERENKVLLEQATQLEQQIKEALPCNEGVRLIKVINAEALKQANEILFGGDDRDSQLDANTTNALASLIDTATKTQIRLSDTNTVFFSQSVDDAVAQSQFLQNFDAQRFDVWVGADYTGFDDTGSDGNGFSVDFGASYAVDQDLTFGLAARYRRVDSEGVAQAFTGDFIGIAALAGVTLPQQIEVEGLVLFEHGFNDIRTGAAKGSFNTNTIAIAVQGSKEFVVEDISLKPSAQVSHSWTFREAFTDSAGTVAGSSVVTQGLARAGATASTFVPLEGNGVIGLSPSLSLMGLAEFNRNPGSNRGGGEIAAGLELALDGDARLTADTGFTVLGDFKSWRLGLSAQIPF